MTRSVVLFLALGLVAAEDAKDVPKKDLKLLKGTWKLMAAEDDGMQVPEDVLKTCQLVINADKHMANVADNTYVGTHKLDPTKKPKTIDIMDTEGPFKDKTVLGIYAIDGDQFMICFGPPGSDRPKEFSAKAGSGYHLHLWKREKK